MKLEDWARQTDSMTRAGAIRWIKLLAFASLTGVLTKNVELTDD